MLLNVLTHDMLSFNNTLVIPLLIFIVKDFSRNIVFHFKAIYKEIDREVEDQTHMLMNSGVFREIANVFASLSTGVHHKEEG